MRSKTQAKIYEIKNRSGSLTYRVDAGQGPDGKRITLGFSTRKEAETYKDKIDSKIASKASPSALADLTQAERYDILAAQERLKNSNASVSEAVDFYLKHNAAHKTVPTVEEALKIWQTEKRKLGLSQKYQESAVRNYFTPFAKKFGRRKLNLITAQEIETYVFKRKTWSSLTKTNHLNYLRTFFSFFIKRGNISLNPVSKITKPKVVEGEPRLLSTNDATLLLNFALSNGYKAECAAMAMIFFCGIRVDEVDRLTWKSIDLEKNFVTVQGKDAKKGRKRVNPIPANAIEWLKLCQPPIKSSRIGPSDYTQRMKRVRNKLKETTSSFVYPQNAMRHSFAGYHLAKHKSAPQTAYLLGHPNPNLLYSTYKELCTDGEAEHFWNILPESIAKRQAAQRRQKEEENQRINKKIKEQLKASGL